jgi:hypothetical protein
MADLQRIVASIEDVAVPVHGALCFVDTEFRLFAKPFPIGGVLVTWGKALRERLRAPGPLEGHHRADVYALLRESLPPSN